MKGYHKQRLVHGAGSNATSLSIRAIYLDSQEEETWMPEDLINKTIGRMVGKT